MSINTASSIVYDGGSDFTISGATLMTNISGGSGLSFGVTAESIEGKLLNPRIYFKFLKSKLNKSELKVLKARVAKLVEYTKELKEIGQQGAYEEFAKKLFVAVRESEAVAVGYDRFILKKHIDKFMKYENLSAIVELDKLEDFPRVIPKDIQNKIKLAQKKGIFDELWILHLNYTKEKHKSNKEKIREKDPILFGKFKFDNDKYYYIADWVDENCDLTLDKFIEKVEVEPTIVPDIDHDYLDAIMKEVREKDKRLADTKPSNYRGLMAVEDKENKPKKKSWWKLW